MTERTVIATQNEVTAAQILLRVDDQLGREHNPAVVAIANAKRRMRPVEGQRSEVEYVVTVRDPSADADVDSG